MIVSHLPYFITHNNCRFKTYFFTRVIVSTLQIGLIAAVAVQSYLSNINITSAYLLGVLGSCVYFYLLSKKIDDVGSTYSLMNDRPKNSAVNNTSAVNYRYTASLTYPNSSRQPIQQQGGVKNEELGPQADVSLAQIPLLYAQYIGQRLAKVGANARLLVPVLVLALLAGRDYFYEGYVPSKLNYIPKDEFIGAVGGFLTLRLTLFINEVGKEFKAEELIGLVPGSLAVTLRSLLFPKK